MAAGTQYQMSSPEALSQHSIFKRIATASTESAPNGSRGAINKVVSRDGELFLAHGSIIRCGDTRSSRADYKILESEELNFDIKHLSINESGTLLAAYDEHNLVVCTVPSPGFMDNITEDSIKVKSYRVGASVYGDQSLSILDLIWNNIALYDSELVILSSDNHIRSFNLMLSSNAAHSQVNLSNTSNALGLANYVDQPVSISFGSKNESNPTACISLYIFTLDGDVYSLYPYLPYTLHVKESFVKKLFDHSTLALQNAQSDSQRVELLQQLQFTSSLLKNSRVSTHQSKSDKKFKGQQYVTVGPLDTSRLPKVQGPFSIAPFPKLLYSHFGSQIRNVACSETDVLLTTWTNGSCLVLFQDHDLIMRWKDSTTSIDDSEDLGSELTLSTLEYVPLAQNGNVDITFAGASSLLPYQYFIVLAHSVLIRVDFREWGQKLHVAVSSGASEEFAALLAKPLISKADPLSNEPRFEGLAFLNGKHGVFLIRLSDGAVDVQQAKSHGVEFAETMNLKSTKLKSDLPLASYTPYKSCLVGSPAEIKQHLVSAKQKLQVSFVSDKSEMVSNADEVALVDMKNYTNAVMRQRISHLNQIGLLLHFRLTVQHKELKQQISLINDQFSEEKIDRRYDTLKGLFDRTSAAKDKQMAIFTRLDALSSKLKEAITNECANRNTPLNKEEKKWQQKLEEFDGRIVALKEKLTDYERTLRYIKHSLHTGGVQSQERIDASTLQVIKTKLTKEKRYVDQVSSVLVEEVAHLDSLVQQLEI